MQAIYSATGGNGPKKPPTREAPKPTKKPSQK